MKVALIVASMPPQMDGIGHYTTLLAQEIQRGGDTVRVYTAVADTPPDPINGVPVEVVFRGDDTRSVTAILPALTKDAPDWVVLQYNPFSFGKWGRNDYLAPLLRTIKKQLPQSKIAVMCHETFVPLNHWKFAVMRVWQEPQFHAICAAADALFFSIEAWAKRFGKSFAGKPAVHLPVFSNMPHIGADGAEVREELGILPNVLVVGAFGTRHASRQFALMGQTVARLHNEIGNVVLLDLGPHRESVVCPPAPVRVIVPGALPDAAISRHFAAMDIFLSPFVDGVSTRRGSLMVALQHGVASVGTVGEHTDTLFQNANGSALLLTPPADSVGFEKNTLRLAQDAAFRATIANAGKVLYDKHLSLPVVWQQMRRTLAGHAP